MPSYDRSLEEIKDRIDIVDLISEYVQLKKAGQNWKGLCPFHTEKTPSFTVSPAKQIYHCFGCGNGGDAFTFLVRYENISFQESMRILAKKAGVTLKAHQSSPVQTGEKEGLLNLHREALSFYQQNLAKHANARAYLKGRGIEDTDQKKFSLGYALNSWNGLLNYLARKGHKPERVIKAGLAVQGAKGVYDTFRDRIIFPIYDLKGDVTAFGGRSIDGSEPKYLNSPETLIFHKSRTLYGLDRAKDTVKSTGHVLFMEGYLDVIIAHIYGFTNAVAPLGTAVTPEHAKLIKRFTEEAVLAFDSDRAGINAAMKAAAILLEGGLNVRVVSMTENDDPDSFLRKSGKDAFQRLIEEGRSIIDFLMQQKGDRRIKARQALEIISRIPDKILQGTYMKILAEKLNVDERYVREEFQRMKKNLPGGSGKTPPPARQGGGPRPLDETYIIALLLQLPGRVDEACRGLSPEDFRDGVTRSLFEKISGGASDLNHLLSECEGEEKDFLTSVSIKDDFENPEKVLDDCIMRLKHNRRKKILQEIQNRIREAEQKKDFGQLKKLQAEYMKLRTGKD